MRTSVVIVLDPWTDDANDLVERREAVLPDAFAFEGLVIRFDHAVLLGRMRVNELLFEAVRCEQPSIAP